MAPKRWFLVDGAWAMGSARRSRIGGIHVLVVMFVLPMVRRSASAGGAGRQRGAGFGGIQRAPHRPMAQKSCGEGRSRLLRHRGCPSALAWPITAKTKEGGAGISPGVWFQSWDSIASRCGLRSGACIASFRDRLARRAAGARREARRKQAGSFRVGGSSLDACRRVCRAGGSSPTSGPPGSIADAG